MNAPIFAPAMTLLLILMGATQSTAAEDTAAGTTNAQPTTQPATTATATTSPAAGLVDESAFMRAQIRGSIEEQTKGLPELGPYPLEQVLNVTLQNRRIVATTSLEPVIEPSRITIAGLSGISLISVGSPAAQEPSERNAGIFHIIHYDLEDPQWALVGADLSILPGMVNLAAVWQAPHTNRMVQLIQQTPIAPSPDNPQLPDISLWVQGFAEHDGQMEQTIRLHLTASDLPTMQREHPQEVYAYVLPALRQLGMDRLLWPDEHIVWQVFPGAYQSRPLVLAQIKEILPELNNPDFRKRQMASKRLRELGRAGELELLIFDTSGLTPEQQSRIGSILVPYRTLSPQEVENLHDDKSFLLDCLLIEDEALRRAALKRLEALVAKPVAFDVEAELTNRQSQVAKLRSELLPPPATQNTH